MIENHFFSVSLVFKSKSIKLLDQYLNKVELFILKTQKN